KILVGEINNKILDLDFLSSFFDDEDEAKIKEILISEAPLPTSSEWKFKLPTGETTWVQFRVTQLDEEHNLIVIRNIGMLKQITAEKYATKAQYEALIEKAPNFMFIYKNGIVEYFNQAFTTKLGYTHEELEQRRDMPTFLVAPEFRKDVATFLLETRRDHMKGKIAEEMHNQYQIPDITAEIELISKDGTKIPVYAIIRRIYSKKDSIVQGVLVDLSEITKLQETKFDFLTLSQHFLRTPIANLKGYLDLYKSQIGANTNIEVKKALEEKFFDVFERNVNRLVSLANDLNDISLIRSGKLKCNLRGEDLVPILRQVVNELEYFLRRYRIEINIEYPLIPYVVNLDRDRISQALRNVLENAIKFTGHGSIKISLFAQESEKIILKVEDTGVGINPANLTDIGKPFMTFHKSSSGLGLGLYLTKEIIQDHNGTIEIESEGFHKGTSVTISLPLLVPLIPFSTIIDSIHKDSKTDIDQIIENATISKSEEVRRDAISQLGNYKGPQKEKVISALEKCILYDKNQSLRNLASDLYSQLMKKKEENSVLKS
ncbi:MAG: PAS domain-containing sensor histidine kinase, partial [Candidatus Hodarchaeales archaeon]